MDEFRLRMMFLSCHSLRDLSRRHSGKNISNSSHLSSGNCFPLLTANMSKNLFSVSIVGFILSFLEMVESLRMTSLLEVISSPKGYVLALRVCVSARPIMALILFYLQEIKVYVFVLHLPVLVLISINWPFFPPP